MIRLILLLLLGLSGCAYPKRTDYFTAAVGSPSKAVVYLYRTQTQIDSLNPDIPTFYINGKKIGRLSLGGYYRVEVDPGPLKLTYRDYLLGIPTWMSPLKVEFTAEANKVYFVKFSIESILRVTRFELVPDPLGEAEIKTTQLLVR